MRNYFQYKSDQAPASYISDWMDLEEGKHYKMVGMMKQQKGLSHFSTSVEYRKEGETFMNHRQAMRQTQYLEVTNHGRFHETWYLNVDNSFDGKFRLQFNKNGNTIVTEEIPAGISEADLTFRLYDDYFHEQVQSMINVERSEVTESNGTTHYSYKIKLAQSIQDFSSFDNVQVLVEDDKRSQFSLIMPHDYANGG